MRHIRHDDAVHARRLEVLNEALEAVVQHRVDVAHADERNVGKRADLPDDLEFLLRRHAAAQRADGGVLDDRPVRHRIGERQAELDDVRPGLFRLFDGPERRLDVGRARCDIDEDSLAARCLERGHFFIETRLHIVCLHSLLHHSIS